MDAWTRQTLIQLVGRNALKTGTFVLASGRESHYYLDCRRITLTSEGAATIGYGICSVLRQYDIDAVGGLTMGADPIVGAVLAVSSPIRVRGLRGFLVRKEPKGHGTGQLIEGVLKEGDRVAILEDVATTGGSAWKAVLAARDMGATVEVVIPVVDRMEGAAEFFADQGIPFHPLITVKDLGVEPLTIGEVAALAG